MNEGLVYIGKVIDLQPIPEADFIVSATVVCGSGGKWRGVVKKSDFFIGSLCIVYLPDALIHESEEMSFMKSSGWRVRMRRFKGAPSEVVITPIPVALALASIGTDVTELCGVTKYHKPIPANLQGKIKGDFPSFIPKTDELNYQKYPELVDKLVGKPFYITEKADGSSTTAYRYKGSFGLCSRNYELEKDENNGYWKVCLKHDLENKLPESIALQFETCGPKIQSNPMSLPDIQGFAFSAYNIPEHRYLDMMEFHLLCDSLDFPICRFLDSGESFCKDGLELLGEGTYSNGKQREGVVVRSQENFDGQPISFKVINLEYEK